MAVKMNSRIITKNHAADPEIWFLTKSISKPYDRATAMPTAWELRLKFETYCLLDKELFGSLISSSNNHGDNSNQNSNESQNHTNRNNDINSKKF